MLTPGVVLVLSGSLLSMFDERVQDGKGRWLAHVEQQNAGKVRDDLRRSRRASQTLNPKP